MKENCTGFYYFTGNDGSYNIMLEFNVDVIIFSFLNPFELQLTISQFS